MTAGGATKRSYEQQGATQHQKDPFKGSFHFFPKVNQVPCNVRHIPPHVLRNVTHSNDLHRHYSETQSVTAKRIILQITTFQTKLHYRYHNSKALHYRYHFNKPDYIANITGYDQYTTDKTAVETHSHYSSADGYLIVLTLGPTR